MTEPLTAVQFKWFLTLLTGVVAGIWFVYDSINLVRTRNLDRTDPVVRDRHFGYVMGLIIGAIGVYGSLRFQGIV